MINAGWNSAMDFVFVAVFNWRILAPIYGAVTEIPLIFAKLKKVHPWTELNVDVENGVSMATVKICRKGEPLKMDYVTIHAQEDGANGHLGANVQELVEQVHNFVPDFVTILGPHMVANPVLESGKSIGFAI